MKEHQTEIYEYIRRKKSGKVAKVGVILAFRSEDGGTIRVGWSKANFKAGDTFNALQGLELARMRARHETPTMTPLPACIRKQYRQFGARAIRYFKNAHTVILDVPV